MNLAAFQSAQRAYDNMAPPDECEEGDFDTTIDGHKASVSYYINGTDVEIHSIVIAGMEFNPLTFSPELLDSLQSEAFAEEFYR